MVINSLRESINMEEMKKEDEDLKTIEGRDINVCIRSRPLLGFEIEQGYYDCLHAHENTFYFFEPKLDFKQDPTIDR